MDCPFGAAGWTPGAGLFYTGCSLAAAGPVAAPTSAGASPMSLIKDMKSRFGIFGELWSFMRIRKKWWLGPIMIFLVLLGILIVFTEGSALAPFIYALF
jgi:hypothetical protein